MLLFFIIVHIDVPKPAIKTSMKGSAGRFLWQILVNENIKPRLSKAVVETHELKKVNVGRSKLRN